ncbi:hypothetical protein CWJ38_004544 [Escherichia coli]|nr:hypothetical protein [Escherichia coli]EFI3270443.1 hypothetical protein [Escherichia coli]EFM7212478.1 hypothetical protein [Escherichia coli]EHP9992411.1 hypothetical protein [Escherichia coli]EIH2306565.1 hypothetical protein [Escherichia coli]
MWLIDTTVRISESANQRISESANQRISESANQRISESAITVRFRTVGNNCGHPVSHRYTV